MNLKKHMFSKRFKSNFNASTFLNKKLRSLRSFVAINCPRRVLAQTAKTRGGILEVPAY